VAVDHLGWRGLPVHRLGDAFGGERCVLCRHIAAPAAHSPPRATRRAQPAARNPPRATRRAQSAAALHDQAADADPLASRRS
jgi:hypothetical protein